MVKKTKIVVVSLLISCLCSLNGVCQNMTEINIVFGLSAARYNYDIYRTTSDRNLLAGIHLSRDIIHQDIHVLALSLGVDRKGYRFNTDNVLAMGNVNQNVSWIALNIGARWHHHLLQTKHKIRPRPLISSVFMLNYVRRIDPGWENFELKQNATEVNLNDFQISVGLRLHTKGQIFYELTVSRGLLAAFKQFDEIGRMRSTQLSIGYRLPAKSKKRRK